MHGKFTNVKKTLSPWCFIDGSDGKTYFCHRQFLKNKDDWKYVWTGNECEFSVKEEEYIPDRKPTAFMIVPVKKDNPNYEKAKSLAVQEELRRAKKQNKKTDIYIKSGDRNLDIISNVRVDEFYYMIIEKKLNSKDDYTPVKPERLWKNKQMAEEAFFFYKAEKGDINNYQLKRCIVCKKGSSYVVKELLIGNKIGKELYFGPVQFY